MLTTELHLVLKLRYNGAIPFLPTPCLLQHAGTTFTVPFLSQLFGAAVFLTFIEPEGLLPCSQETTAGALSTANCDLIIIIFINCNWVFTRWQWLFYTYTDMKKERGKKKSN